MIDSDEQKQNEQENAIKWKVDQLAGGDLIDELRLARWYRDRPDALAELVAEHKAHLNTTLAIGSNDSGIGLGGSKSDKK